MTFNREEILSRPGLSVGICKNKYVKFDEFFEENEIPPYKAAQMYFENGFREGWHDYIPENTQEVSIERIKDIYYNDFDPNYNTYKSMYPDCKQQERLGYDYDLLGDVAYIHWECGYLFGVIEKEKIKLNN